MVTVCGVYKTSTEGSNLYHIDRPKSAPSRRAKLHRYNYVRSTQQQIWTKNKHSAQFARKKLKRTEINLKQSTRHGGGLRPYIVPPWVLVVERGRTRLVDLRIDEVTTVTLVRSPLLPLRGVEVFLIPDVARELLPPLLHQALITLGDEKPTLRLAVGDGPRR
jgi:hypothetical protein